MHKVNYSVLRVHLWAWMFAMAGLVGAVRSQPSSPHPPQQRPPEVTLRVMSGVGSMSMYASTEVPFWTQELTRLSGGRYTARIARYDLAAVPAPEMLKLTGLGVIPFSTALLTPNAYHSPELGMPDLAGMNPDLGTLQKNLIVFRPYLEKLVSERYRVKLLALYSYPEQVLYCKNPINRLADLAGRRVRVSSITQTDFVNGLRGIPVHVDFIHVSNYFDSGAVECAIMAASSGNLTLLFNSTRYLYAMPITWTVSMFGANQAAWDELPPDLKNLLNQAIPQLERKLWTQSRRLHAQSVACNQGLASCRSDNKGRLTLVNPSDEDKRLSLKVFHDHVLPRWLSRCSPQCAVAWDATFGSKSPAAATLPNSAP